MVLDKRARELSPEVHKALHRLWTKAVGTADYIKAEWIALELAIRRDVDG